MTTFKVLKTLAIREKHLKKLLELTQKDLDQIKDYNNGGWELDNRITKLEGAIEEIGIIAHIINTIEELEKEEINDLL